MDNKFGVKLFVIFIVLRFDTEKSDNSQPVLILVKYEISITQILKYSVSFRIFTGLYCIEAPSFKNSISMTDSEILLFWAELYYFWLTLVVQFNVLVSLCEIVVKIQDSHIFYKFEILSLLT